MIRFDTFAESEKIHHCILKKDVFWQTFWFMYLWIQKLSPSRSYIVRYSPEKGACWLIVIHFFIIMTELLPATINWYKFWWVWMRFFCKDQVWTDMGWSLDEGDWNRSGESKMYRSDSIYRIFEDRPEIRIVKMLRGMWCHPLAQHTMCNLCVTSVDAQHAHAYWRWE